MHMTSQLPPRPPSPSTQALGQVAALPHCPFVPHVSICVSLVHSVAPGVHWKQPPSRQRGVPPSLDDEPEDADDPDDPPDEEPDGEPDEEEEGDESIGDPASLEPSAPSGPSTPGHKETPSFPTIALHAIIIMPPESVAARRRRFIASSCLATASWRNESQSRIRAAPECQNFGTSRVNSLRGHRSHHLAPLEN
jgi:hypothetical protein